MDAKKLKAINITAALVLILLIAAAVAIGFDRRNARIRKAKAHFSTLQNDAGELFDSDAEHMNDTFQDLRQELRRYNGLRSFILYDDNGRVYYVYGRNSSDVRFATTGDEKYRSTITLAENAPFDISFTYSAGPGITAEAVYTTILEEEIFATTQILLIALLIIAIFLAVVLGVFLREKPSRGGSVIYGAPPSSSIGEDAAAPASGDNNEGLYSEESGFCREMFLRPRLESELKRAAAFDQDLVLGLVRCIESDENSAAEGEKELYENASAFFPFQDLLFEYDKRTFAVILPNPDLDQGIELLNNFQRHLFEIEGCCTFDTAIGLSSRNGRLLDHDRIINEAETALKKAGQDPETRLIGFRPDPGKYRAYLAQ